MARWEFRVVRMGYDLEERATWERIMVEWLVDVPDLNLIDLSWRCLFLMVV